MPQEFILKRTTSINKDFQLLVSHLDHELWNELKEDQSTYDQYNKVPDLDTVALIYANNFPVACGCFKQFEKNTIEIKRMFVEKLYRRKGLSKLVLIELENWAKEMNYKYAVLETSIYFDAAKSLYQNSGYKIIPNYGQYAGLPKSVCMKKDLSK